MWEERRSIGRRFAQFLTACVVAGVIVAIAIIATKISQDSLTMAAGVVIGAIITGVPLSLALAVLIYAQARWRQRDPAPGGQPSVVVVGGGQYPQMPMQQYRDPYQDVALPRSAPREFDVIGD